MPTPGEHKTVQARILKYAEEVGWTVVPRVEAERRRGFDPDGATPEERAEIARRRRTVLNGLSLAPLRELMTVRIRDNDLGLPGSGDT